MVGKDGSWSLILSGVQHTHACTQEYAHVCVYTHTHGMVEGDQEAWGCHTTATQLSPCPHGEGDKIKGQLWVAEAVEWSGIHDA